MTTRFHRQINIPTRRSRFSSNRPPMQSHFRNDFHAAQRDWEDEVDRFRRDFFRNTPFEDNVRREPRLRLFADRPSHFDVPETTIRIPQQEVSTSQVPHPDQYCVEFELANFEPEDISVKVEDNHLIIGARKEVGGNVQEVSKTVELPSHVDPEKLISCFSPDGILTVETIQPPCYESVQRSSAPPTPSEAGSAATDESH